MSRKRARTIADIVAVFAISRVGAYLVGIRFDTSSLAKFWQYPDPVLLKRHLLQTLYYSHGQPPLFGLLLGVALKLPVSFATTMHAAYIALGLTATLALFVLLVQLGVPDQISGVAAIAFAVLPATILYENWLFYEYPTMTLLLCAAVALHRFLSRNSAPAGFAFFALMATVVYLRSVFQIVWVLAALGMLLVLTKRRRLILVCCALPLLAVGLLCAKNAVVFGVPTTSSWLGMNLARETVSKIDIAKRRRLVAQGSIHRISLTEPFAPLSAYAKAVPQPARTGIPILDESVKAEGARTKYGPRTNYNNKTYVAVSRWYLSDAFWVIRHEPAIYLGSVKDALKTSMRPSTEYRFIYNSRFQIIAYASFVERYVYLRRSPDGIGFGILAAYLFAADYLAVLITQLARGTRKPDPALTTLLFLGLTVLYAYGVASLTEVGENQRMRFFLDPLVLVLVVHGLRALALRMPTRNAIQRAGLSILPGHPTHALPKAAEAA